jgi:hypothetical protein
MSSARSTVTLISRAPLRLSASAGTAVWLVIEAGAAALAPQPVAAATATSSGSITRR